MKAALPANEPQRLAALRRYEILDTNAEQEFDDITLLASQICETPIALISLVDEDRQWFKSKVGMTEDQTSRDVAFCAHGILQPELFIVEDAANDIRFSTNPLVTGKSQIRFYAGSPLITPDGHALGMLCVNDKAPRQLRPEQKQALQALARQVVAQLELRRNLKTLQETVLQRERAETELRATHDQLMEASRQAGMAEVATTVLHNVGNVLNSVNVSSSMIADQVRNSRVVNIAKIVSLFDAHADRLGEFLTSDPKGKRIPDYLGNLASRLMEEQESVLREVESLVNNIAHIRDIVAMQQSNAKIGGVLEKIKPGTLIDQALDMSREALNRHRISVVRDSADVPAVVTDKRKVLQILVNLLSNAKFACNESARKKKTINVRAWNEATRIKISVSDNGIGISSENLVRIFSHGFTTRKDGHGFGLHSAALAARELGGALEVFSEGAERGATFTLDLPLSTENCT